MNALLDDATFLGLFVSGVSELNLRISFKFNFDFSIWIFIISMQYFKYIFKSIKGTDLKFTKQGLSQKYHST
jgi:hypothetical protein